MTAVGEAARAWYDAGACILPAATDGTKMPAVQWKDYQTQRPNIDAWFNTPRDGLGMICGAVSGNVEMLEFEGRAADLVTEFISRLANELGGDFVARFMTYVERTPSGGFHWLYRVSATDSNSAPCVKKNTKLASRPKEPTPESPSHTETLIETRGEGGWTILAPSAGRTHATGLGWSIVSGTAGVVPTLTEEEYETVHAVARSFDELPAATPVEHRMPLPGPVSPSDGLAPGQDYEARADWIEDLLGPLGWTVWKRHGETLILTRPGKRFGASATLNYDGNNNLYVFTSSTDFPENTSWTKFGAYTFLNHNGDYAEAARALSTLGYGTRREPTRILRLVPPPSSVDGTSALPIQEPALSVPVTLTDDGNARLLVASAKGELLFSHERKMWLHWNGKRWEWEAGGATIIQRMREIVRSMDPRDDVEKKHKWKSLGKRAITDAVLLAQNDPELVVTMDQLDSDPYSLNTPNGVLSLLTGALSAPTPGALHTRMTGCAIDPESPHPLWDSFIAETFVGDVDLIAFVQRLAGYSATGAVTHHVLPFLHGTGANGKSVFLEVMQAILGDYSGTAPADFLLANRREDSDSVAMLAGQRFVVCSEVGPTAHFDEQKVKLLTGGDRITARRLYERNFTWIPTHHLWLAGNHQPRVTAGGDSFWRRLALVPFINTVPEEKRDPNLASKLVEKEGGAILAWLVEGAKAQVNGLAHPDTVRVATAGYAEEEDALGRFLSERVARGGDSFHNVINTKTLYAAYEQWCHTENVRPMPSHVFGREIKNRGIESAKRNGMRYYIKITLLNAESDEDNNGNEQYRF